MTKNTLNKQKRKSNSRVDPEYQILGHNARSFREACGFSRGEACETLDISAQQLAKCEEGTNRIQALLLHKMANLYHRNIADFYEGIDKAMIINASASAATNRSSLRLIKIFKGLKSKDMQKKLLRIARILAE